MYALISFNTQLLIYAGKSRQTRKQRVLGLGSGSVEVVSGRRFPRMEVWPSAVYYCERGTPSQWPSW